MPYLFLAGVILYHLCEGRTEAMTWLGRYPISRIDPGEYHAWRLGEGLGILLAVWGAFSMTGAGMLSIVAGAWLMGWLVYEASYTLGVGYKLWEKPYPFRILSWEIQFKRWWFPVALVVGLILFVGGVYA